MLEILSHFRKKRIFGPISSQNMRVISVLWKLVCSILKWKKTTLPISWHVTHWVHCKVFQWRMVRQPLFYFLITSFRRLEKRVFYVTNWYFKSRAPITGPSKMKKRFLAFNAPISHARTICHYSAATICSFWNAFQWCAVLDVRLEKFRSFIKLMFRLKVIQCHYCKRCCQLDCCFQLGVQIMRNFHRKRR